MQPADGLLQEQSMGALAEVREGSERSQQQSGAAGGSERSSNNPPGSARASPGARPTVPASARLQQDGEKDFACQPKLMHSEL